MKTLSFVFDGHDYFIHNAGDEQDAPEHGDTVRDCQGGEVAYVTHDGEYWVAESCQGPEFVAVHENEPDAVWTAVKAVLSTY